MSFVPILLVVLSGLSHATWNLFTKRSLNKHAFLWFCQWTAILIFLPIMLYQSDSFPGVSPVGWLTIGLSMLLHGLYVVVLAQAYVFGDMSKVYPIMRGTSPLLVPLLSVLILKEALPLIGWLGILLIVGGIAMGGEKGTRLTLANWGDKTVLLAMTVGILITSYTVVDRLALDYIPATILNWLSNVGNLIALTYLALGSGQLKREWSMNWRTILLGGILAPGGYILFLIALKFMPVSQLAPMREIGTVFGTVMAIFILRERQASGRIAAAVLITAGIVLLSQAG
ncbi:LuxR family transcriptional regulator [Cohnella endophytica]|uniref:LuxR family transcriptional regulator n=1 Tax=Cohnella endophytica TaxID=2419778 RepID=A0A494Y5N3_9BACL|nr:EamA family transporter [Cohnella endophytica]RKP56825.1 LuxR family transcriptional regulator [Cohnella endophytica]